MRLRKKKQQPDITVQQPLILQVPPEQAEKDQLELNLLRYKAAYERLSWDYIEKIHSILDDTRELKYIA